MNEWIKFFLGGGVLLSIVEGIKALISWAIRRRAQKNDKAEEKAEKDTDKHLEEIDHAIAQMDGQMTEVKESLRLQKRTNMLILQDRLRHLARHFIADGEISFDDRDAWNAMHDCYHENGGNGAMKPTYDLVNSLPIKKG